MGLSPQEQWIHIYLACWFGFGLGCVLSYFSHLFAKPLEEVLFVVAVAALATIVCVFPVNVPEQQSPERNRFLMTYVVYPMIVTTLYFGWPRPREEKPPPIDWPDQWFESAGIPD